jgi:hypothetical protein
VECIGTIGMGYPGTLLRRRQRGILMHSYDNRSQIRALVIGGWAGLARLGASGSVPANHKKIAQGSARVVGRAQAADRDSRANNSATARDSAQPVGPTCRWEGLGGVAAGCWLPFACCLPFGGGAPFCCLPFCGFLPCCFERAAGPATVMPIWVISELTTWSSA